MSLIFTCNSTTYTIADAHTSGSSKKNYSTKPKKTGSKKVSDSVEGLFREEDQPREPDMILEWCAAFATQAACKQDMFAYSALHIPHPKMFTLANKKCLATLHRS